MRRITIVLAVFAMSYGGANGGGLGQQLKGSPFDQLSVNLSPSLMKDSGTSVATLKLVKPEVGFTGQGSCSGCHEIAVQAPNITEKPINFSVLGSTNSVYDVEITLFNDLADYRTSIRKVKIRRGEIQCYAITVNSTRDVIFRRVANKLCNS